MGRTIPSFSIALAIEKMDWKHNNNKKLPRKKLFYDHMCH
jgi:hypothetical protein